MNLVPFTTMFGGERSSYVGTKCCSGETGVDYIVYPRLYNHEWKWITLRSHVRLIPEEGRLKV
jgi:hypothetical protein